jgi:hypothetical protein
MPVLGTSYLAMSNAAEVLLKRLGFQHDFSITPNLGRLYAPFRKG